MEDGRGAIPTIELARVSAGADAIVQQFDSYAASDPIGAARMHAAVMALVEPELARTAMARSSVAALRATVAELQELVRLLTTPSPALEWLRDMPLPDRQALNLHMISALGRAASLAHGVDDARAVALEWVAGRIEGGCFEPKIRLEDKAA